MRNRRTNNHKTKQTNRLLRLIEITLIFLIFLVIILYMSQPKTQTQNIANSGENSGANSSEQSQAQENSENTENKENEATQNEENQQSGEQQNDAEKPARTTFTMALTGDIMCHDTLYKDAYNSKKKTYDFSYLFEDIKYYLQTADVTVGNLETTFAGAEVGYSNYPTFNTPEHLAKDLKKAGFNVVSTANNHCMDKGYNGLVSTIKYLDKVDLSHTGTYNSEEASQRTLIKNVKGLAVAFLSFTYGTNGIPIPAGKEYSVNMIDKKFILDRINSAKEKNPDVICVSMHWGTEYQPEPNETQKDLADFLFKNGVDIIIGNHPHVIQKMEKRTVKLDNNETKDGFVVYSLGNFMSAQVKEHTNDTAIVNLQITKDNTTGKLSIDQATYVPVYCQRKTDGSSPQFKLLDIKNEIAAYEADVANKVDTKTYNTLVNQLEYITDTLGKEIK